MANVNSDSVAGAGWLFSTLKVIIISIPALASTAAAYLAAQATYQVYQTEHARLQHDRLRHVSEIIRDYSRSHTASRQCLQVLIDDTLLTTEEFLSIVSAPERFRFDPNKHTPLIGCLRQPIVGHPASYQWTDADTRSITSSIGDELSRLDSYLISLQV
jgi:hypothetical protein